jgi:hypothetical protein
MLKRQSITHFVLNCLHESGTDAFTLLLWYHAENLQMVRG